MAITSRRQSDLRFSILFSSPALIIYVGFMIIPIFLAGYYGMLRWDGASAARFVGLDNFIYMLTWDDYHIVLKNTLLNVIVSSVLKIPLAVTFAYLLYRTTRGFRLFRFTIFLPVVISSAAIALMFTIFLNGDRGLVNTFLSTIGLESWRRIWLGDPKVVVYSVIIPRTWQMIGLHMVIFLAAFQSIPEEVMESAYIDGAGAFSIFSRIALPLVWEAVQISIILNVTGALKEIEYPWIMTRGGPGVRSAFLGVMVYSRAFEEGRIGLASAVSISILVYAIIFTVAFKWITRERGVDF